jgi:hypothetical protein
MASKSRNGLSVVSAPAWEIFAEGKFIDDAAHSQSIAATFKENGLTKAKSQAAC